MTLISEPEELVWKVKTGRMSAHDALLIMKRLFEKNAKLDEARNLREIRGYLEDEAAKENMRAVLKTGRRTRMERRNPEPTHLRRLRV